MTTKLYSSCCGKKVTFDNLTCPKCGVLSKNIVTNPKDARARSKVSVKDFKKDMGKVSDGYHTFDELYEHRITLFIALCKLVESRENPGTVWRSYLHSDGSLYAGWFILGINQAKGQQITYHLPIKEWENTNFAVALIEAPSFDGHTSKDVLKRIRLLFS